MRGAGCGALLVGTLAVLCGGGCKRSPRHASLAVPDAGTLALPHKDAGALAVVDAGTEAKADADEPWAGDAFTDAPEPTDDEVARWETVDRNHREFWFGLWHASPDVGAGYNDLIALYSDGRFIIRGDQNECGDGLSAARGTWTLERGVLVLESTWRDRLVGSTCNETELESEGGTTQHEHGPVTHRLRVQGCRRSDWDDYWEERHDRTCMRMLEAPGPLRLLVGHGGAFWRIDRDGVLED